MALSIHLIFQEVSVDILVIWFAEILHNTSVAGGNAVHACVLIRQLITGRLVQLINQRVVRQHPSGVDHLPDVLSKVDEFLEYQVTYLCVHTPAFPTLSARTQG